MAMARSGLSLRLAGPTLLMSTALFASCTAAAIVLHHQQAGTVAVLSERVEVRRLARLLDESLDDLIGALYDDSDPTEVHIDRVAAQLAAISAATETEEARRLLAEVVRGFSHFKHLWGRQSRAGGSATAAARREALLALKGRVILPSRRLRGDLGGQVERALMIHSRSVRRMTWGLLAVGGIGSLGGLILGYGMSRALGRSIRRLSIQIRDAAGLLGQGVNTVIQGEGGELQDLDRQMQRVALEIQKVMETLRRREQEVRRADQMAMVGQLAAGLAHEIRNPLTLIKVLVQVNAEEAEARGQPSDDFRAMEQEIRRIERRVQTLLDFTRPPRPERRRLDLSGVVDSTLHLIEGRAAQQQVALRASRPEDPVMIEADGEQVRQVLVNLLLNALDAMPHGGKLEIDLRPAADGRHELRVRDTGPGIAPHILPRLGEPFATSKEAGLGLGLAISRRIAEDHGGRLEGSNSPEGGALFTLTLPAAAPEGPAPGRPEAASPHADSADYR